MSTLPTPGILNPGLLPIVEAMHRAQVRLWDALSAFGARNKGARALPASSNFDPFTAYTWNALIPLAGYPEGRTDMALTRDRSYDARWSAHEQMSLRAMEHPLIEDLEAMRAGMRAHVPVLAKPTKGFVQMVIPMDNTGTMKAPYWRFMEHNFRSCLDGPLERCTMLAVLSFLAALPPPTYLYSIGSKEYWGDREETAMAQHLYLSSPGADFATRKGPAHYPDIKRITPWEESTRMGLSLLQTWRAEAKAAQKAAKKAGETVRQGRKGTDTTG